MFEADVSTRDWQLGAVVTWRLSIRASGSLFLFADFDGAFWSMVFLWIGWPHFGLDYTKPLSSLLELHRSNARVKPR